MTVAIIMPWRDHDGSREDARRFVTTRYKRQFPGWPVVLAELPLGDWSKGRAVARVRDKIDADVLIIADADCVVEEQSLRACVRAVEVGPSRWAMPYTFVHRLREDSTAKLIETRALPGPGSKLERAGYHGTPGGGIVVITADAYDECPIDPRFLGWGGEDTAFGIALNCLHGRGYQSPGVLWHLYHEPATIDRQTPPVSAALVDQYRAAARFPRQMRYVVRGEAVPDADPVEAVHFRSQMRRTVRIGLTLVRLDAKGTTALTDPDMIEVMRRQPGVVET